MPDSNDNLVSVIDSGTNTVTAALTVGDNPLGVTVTPDGLRAEVTNAFGPSVSVIDTPSNTVGDTVRVGYGPFGMAMTPEFGPPTNKNQGKKGGWRGFTIPRKFKNQEPR